MAPIVLSEGEIECVVQFPYIDSLIMSNGRLDVEIGRRIAYASRAFWSITTGCFQ